MQFDTLLSSESEDGLLNRSYFFWSSARDEKKYSLIETTNSGISQIQIYLDTIKNGRTRKNKPGICDVKIEIADGYSCVGGRSEKAQNIIMSFGVTFR